MEDENPLTELYLSLLARAIDKERIEEAHPAFVHVIEQLTPDEGIVLFELKTMRAAGFGDKTTMVSLNLTSQEMTEELSSSPLKVYRGGISMEVMSGTFMVTKSFNPFPVSKLSYPGYLSMYAEHLASLNLVSMETVQEAKEIEETVVGFRISKFGELFVKACIPENFDISTLASLREDSEKSSL